MLQSAFPGWPRLLAPWTALEGAKVSISDSHGEAGKVCARTNRRKFFQNTHSPLPSIRTFKLRVTRNKYGGAWWAAVCGVAKSRTRLSDFTFTFHFHALEKEMASHSSVLAWRIPGTGEPGGLPSMGSHRVGHA